MNNVLMKTINNKKTGLYIHVPFCNKKCNYCDFYSFSADPAIKSRYTDAVIKEIRSCAERYSDRLIDTVYIGGGTPTSLGTSLLCRIVKSVYESFCVDKDCEVTVETNPGIDICFSSLRQSGVNRLSIGLQSANEQELLLLGRIHSLDDYISTVRLAREAGFDNISTDIMFSLPSQTLSLLDNTLNTVISASPEHISAYSLKIEKGTPFYKIKDSLCLPNEDDDADMYLYICNTLDRSGYKHYEISNFACPGKESRHNLRYWNCEEYIGIGPGAHSFINGERYAYVRDINAVISSYESGLYDKSIFSEKSTIDSDEAIRERIMLGLRLSSGVSIRLLEKLASREKITASLLPLASIGLVYMDDERVSLTDKGMYVSNAIIARLSDLAHE